MPGSHGGGHGGGGSFGSKSSVSFSRRRSFPGSTRYRYYNRRGKERVFYYMGAPERKSAVATGLLVLLIAGICTLIVWGILAGSVSRRLSEDKCIKSENTVFDIDDHLTSYEEDQLKTQMNAFYEKTGVQPVLYLCNYSSVPDSYYGKKGAKSDRDMERIIEDFAYDKYLEIFDDEGHWLIVFCKNDKNIGKSDSTWLDMAGDDTEHTVTESLFNSFRKDLQRSLKAGTTVGEGLYNAFVDVTERALEFETIMLIPIVLIVGLSVFGIVSLIIERKTVNDYCKYKSEKKAERKAKIEAQKKQTGGNDL